MVLAFLSGTAAAQSGPRIGTIETIAGVGVQGYGGDDPTTTPAFLNAPSGIAKDGAGNWYISDSGNHRIRKVTSTFVISTVAGTGVAGFSGDNGPGTAAKLYSPEHIVFDGAGNLLISDAGNHRIRKLSSDGTITTIAGTGVSGAAGDNGPATSAQLATPFGVAVCPGGSFVIADTNNHAIRRVNSSGVITKIAGGNGQGFFGDGGPAISAVLNSPTGVACDSTGNVFIADYGNHRIRKVITDGTISTIAGTAFHGLSGDGGPATSATLYYPADVAVDTGGNMFIADYFNDRIRQIAPSGIITSAVGSLSYGSSGDGGPATAAQLYSPTGVSVTPSGDLLIADMDNNRIRQVTAGIIRTVAGFGIRGFSGDGTRGRLSVFWEPSGVAVDPGGTVYIADTFNHRIRKLPPNGDISSIVITNPADDGPFDFPYRMVFDGAGNIYTFNHFSDYRLRRINPDGILTTVAGINASSGFGGDGGPGPLATMYQPTSISIDPQGNLFITDTFSYRIRKLDSNGIISTFAGTFSSGFSGDGGPATTAQFTAPVATASDRNGNLFIADGVRIRKVDTNGIINTIAGTGVSGFSGDGGPATLAQLSNPVDLAVDNFGNLFISERTRIRMIDTGGMITTVAGTGTSGYSGDGGLATAANIFAEGIAVDGAGNVYFADRLSHRIRRVNFAPGPNVPAITGITPSFSRRSNSVAAAITGTNLGSVTAVSFSGSDVTAVVEAGATNTNLPVTITVSDTAAPGSRLLTATNSFGVSDTFLGFTVVNVRPDIENINPRKALAGSTITMTVSGRDLAGATSVAFSGTGITAAILPGGTATTLPISISVAANATTTFRSFTVTSPDGISLPYAGFTVVKPSISSIAPSQVTAGMSFDVVLIGSELSSLTSLTLSGSRVTASIANGSTDQFVLLKVVVPADAPLGNRQVSLSAPGVPPVSATFNVLPSGPDGVITTVAGGLSESVGDGGPAVLANVNNAEGIAVDSTGSFYVVEQQRFSIRKVSRDGTITTVAGNNSSSQGGIDCPAALACALGNLADVAVDAAGNLFITDTTYGLIRKVTPAGVMSRFAGEGHRGSTGDGGSALLAKLAPEGIAIDQSGNVYVSDSTFHRVRKIATNGIITTIAGNGQQGDGGDNGPATSAQLDSPGALAVDAAGNLFIATLTRIRKVTPQGTISTVASLNASGLAVDVAGNLFVADFNNRRIRKMTPLGTATIEVGTGAIAGGDGGPALSAGIYPYDVAVDASGNVFISEFNRDTVRQVTYPPTISGLSQTETNTGNSFVLTVTGTRLDTVVSASFAGTGLTAVIQAGGTATSLTLLVTAGPGATPGSHSLILTRSDGTTVTFAGFSVIARRIGGQVTSQ